MPRIDDSPWFASRPKSSVRDFFELCDQHVDAWEAGARTLERVGGALPAGSVAQQVTGARERLRRARGGDWQPFEQYLHDLGSRYARAGLAFSAWYGVAHGFYDTIVGRAVAAYAAEPARLTQVLLVLGEYMERSLSIIGTDYLAVREHAEREVEARHTRVLDAALDAVIEIDEQGVVTEFNVAAEQTFGYTKADAIGRSLATLIVPERFRDAHRAAVARLAAHGEAHIPGRRIELTAMRADGSEFPVEVALVALTDLDGRHTFTGFVRNLTEQKHTTESLALHAHALEQAEFGIVISDPRTCVITNVNPAYARMTGYDPAELIGTTGDRLVAPASQPTALGVQRTLRERGHHTYELTLQRSDGTNLPVLASSSTVETRFGAAMRISTVIDISEHDRLEQARAAATAALERSAARVEILASTAHEFTTAAGDIASLLDLVACRLCEIIGDGCAVRLISDDGLWLEPSASVHHRDAATLEIARRVVGTERQRIGEGVAGQVAATGVAVLLPELDLEQSLARTPPQFRSFVQQLGPRSALTLPLRARARTIGVINLTRSKPDQPYTLDDQRLAQDLADRAGLAIDNAMLVATLEHRVAERTATLQAVNRELEAFSYSVSHDLRTPLRAIDGFSKMLLGDYADRLDDRGLHYLSRIRAGAERMSQLIDDLLNLARIAQVSLAVSSLDMSALAGDVIAELRHREPARDVRVHIAPGVTARADTRLVIILLENLLGNAWKFTARHAGAQIWFGVEDGAFYVRDTGAGFDMAYAESLFVPFQRLHTAGEYEGTGIGLATVHRIVMRHGGKIWARAEVDKGATFFFTLGEPHDRVG